MQRVGGHSRYGLLETIRQYAGLQLETTGADGGVRDAQARYFAAQMMHYYWALWLGPQQAVALDVHDHEEVLACGQFHVLACGRLEVLAPL